MFSKKFCESLYFLVTTYYNLLNLSDSATMSVVTNLYFKLLQVTTFRNYILKLS